MRNATAEGGCIICRPTPRKYKAGDQFGFTLLSDTHIGSADIDYALITAELDAAQKAGDRILVNGDVFDLILPRDSKRFDPDVLHPKLQGRRDVLNATIDMAFDVFAPYAANLDMIGCGNHEKSVERYHSLDPALLLIDRLQAVAPEDHVIHYGGYMGFADYRWQQKGTGGSSRRLVIYYFHGSGGSAPVTRGMIDFARKQWVSADVVWFGHKHTRWNGSIRTMSCPIQGDAPTLGEQRQIMTGSYFDTYLGQTQESVRKHGRRTNYAADWGLAPQGKGGARLIATLRHIDNGKIDLEVTQ